MHPSFNRDLRDQLASKVQLHFCACQLASFARATHTTSQAQSKAQQLPFAVTNSSVYARPHRVPSTCSFWFVPKHTLSNWKMCPQSRNGMPNTKMGEVANVCSSAHSLQVTGVRKTCRPLLTPELASTPFTPNQQSIFGLLACL